MFFSNLQVLNKSPTIGRQIAKTISVLLHSLVYDKAVFNKLTESTLLCPRLAKEYVYEEKGAYFRTIKCSINGHRSQ